MPTLQNFTHAVEQKITSSGEFLTWAHKVATLDF